MAARVLAERLTGPVAAEARCEWPRRTRKPMMACSAFVLCTESVSDCLSGDMIDSSLAGESLALAVDSQHACSTSPPKLISGCALTHAPRSKKSAGKVGL